MARNLHMENLEFILWLCLFPLTSSIGEYFNAKKRKLLNKEDYSDSVNAYSSLVSRSLLSYEEATALCLKTKWKVTPCNSGEQCWCRLIVPETEIEDKDGNEIYIAGSGCVPKVYAEHVVKLHNESLNCG